eukprot:359936-Chlamydomonas_euryale.AAC.12
MKTVLCLLWEERASSHPPTPGCGHGRYLLGVRLSNAASPWSCRSSFSDPVVRVSRESGPSSAPLEQASEVQRSYHCSLRQPAVLCSRRPKSKPLGIKASGMTSRAQMTN